MDEFEDVDEFWKAFRGKVVGFKANIEGMKEETPKTEFPMTKMGITKLQDLATRNANILPPYDLKRTQEEIERLHRLLRDAETRLNPRKKFSFSARNAASKKKDGLAVGAVAVVDKKKGNGDEQVAKSGLVERAPGSFAISNVKDDVLVMGKDVGSNLGKDQLVKVLIEQCDKAVISAPILLGAVRIEHVTNSNIFLGPCCTSVYLESCTGCTIVCCSHQLRIHSCHDTRLFVRINGHPIIEDCTTMSFAPYVLAYDGIYQHLQEANLAKADVWDNVIDFRWHKKTESPNWNRLSPEDWTPAVVPDKWFMDQVARDTFANGSSAVAAEEESAPPLPAPSAGNDGNDDDDDDDDDDEI